MMLNRYIASPTPASMKRPFVIRSAMMQRMRERAE